MSVPFNFPYLSGREFDYMQEAAKSGHLSGDGEFTKRCNAYLERMLGSKKVMLTTSCTHALEMSALLLDVKPGDEIILPSFTFVSTVNAFVLRGSVPVFIDSRPDTLNIDERLIEEKITPKTKAIVVVHYGGVGCEMDYILAVAKRHGLSVVEDNAQGLFGYYKGRPLGSLGIFATQSFHETKNVHCGEGGALVINDPAYVERAEIIREKGTNRSRFFRGQVDKYTWVDVGSSYLPSELLAAYLWAQLEVADAIQARRREIWELYDFSIQNWASGNSIGTPFVPEHCQSAYHMYYLVMPSLEARQEFIAHLKDRGIQAAFHYQSLHLSDVGMQFGGRVGDCPNAERASDCLVRLPFFNSLARETHEKIIQAVVSF